MPVLLALFLALAPDIGQAATFISGTVTDAAKRPAAGALVGAGMFSGTTDAGGRWLFPPVTRPEWKGGVVVNNPWSWKDGAIIRDTPDAVGRNAPLIIELEFGEGDAQARFWTADLTAEYVRINADYHT